MGYHSTEMGVLPRVYDLFTHLEEIEVNALLVGAVTIITMLVLQRTRLVMLAMVLALAVSTLVTHVFGLSGVRLVSDAYDIPGALPLPILPDLAFLPQFQSWSLAEGKPDREESARAGRREYRSGFPSASDHDWNCGGH